MAIQSVISVIDFADESKRSDIAFNDQIAGAV